MAQMTTRKMRRRSQTMKIENIETMKTEMSQARVEIYQYPVYPV
jgi:hypothetical protein